MSDESNITTFKSLLPSVLTRDNIEGQPCCPNNSVQDYPGHISSVIDYTPEPNNCITMKYRTVSSVSKNCGCDK